MVRVISQETFDSIVRENREELEMSHEEAVEEAVKQFKAQGVDLSNIIISAAAEEDHAVVVTLRALGTLLEQPLEQMDAGEVLKLVGELKAECDKDIAHKLQAGKHRAYELLTDVLDKFAENHDVSHAALTALTSLMTGQPDLLDERGVRLIVQTLKHESDALKQQALRWTRQCCFKHEANRQMIMELDVGLHIHELLSSSTTPTVVRHVCMTMRALTLDDDIRVPYGKAHEHARLLACDYGGLRTITQLLSAHKEDLDTVQELLATLGALVVREEFCREVEECGGLTVLMDVMVTYPDDEKLNRQCLKLMKGLAGSDHVKAKIVQAGAVPLLISAMVRHQSSAPLFATGALAVAAIALRSPSNSQLLSDSGAVEALLQGMREHAADVNVQKACCLAIRNIVSRQRELRKEFLDAGVEELLRAASATHGAHIESNAKDALRDLGCDVQLTERWTGKGGGISQ